MNPSNPARIGLAFAAGLVVALASVMVYIKTSPGVNNAQATPTVQQTRPPESLSAGKVEVPAAPPVAPVSTPLPQVPAAPPAPAAPAASVVRHTTARTHYPRRSPSPASQSSIRVEVSQMKLPDSPVAPSAPMPVAASPQGVPQQPPPLVPQYTPPPAPAPPQAHTVTLQAGTSLIVRLGETISTDHSYSGDTFRATLDRPIVLDGFVIADKGSKVLGKVVAADKAGKFEGTANLQMTLTEISTTDGQRVRIETGFFNKKGPSNSKQEAAKIGGGAVLGAIIGAIAGGGKGAAIGAGAGGAAGTGAVALGKSKPAVVPNETQLTFQLASPTTITEHLN
jgi:hypothetical protein